MKIAVCSSPNFCPLPPPPCPPVTVLLPSLWTGFPVPQVPGGHLHRHAWGRDHRLRNPHLLRRPLNWSLQVFPSRRHSTTNDLHRQLLRSKSMMSSLHHHDDLYHSLHHHYIIIMTITVSLSNYFISSLLKKTIAITHHYKCKNHFMK